jgi:hypothetical protein
VHVARCREVEGRVSLEQTVPGMGTGREVPSLLQLTMLVSANWQTTYGWSQFLTQLGKTYVGILSFNN